MQSVVHRNVVMRRMIVRRVAVGLRSFLSVFEESPVTVALEADWCPKPTQSLWKRTEKNSGTEPRSLQSLIQLAYCSFQSLGLEVAKHIGTHQLVQTACRGRSACVEECTSCGHTDWALAHAFENTIVLYIATCSTSRLECSVSGRIPLGGTSGIYFSALTAQEPLH